MGAAVALMGCVETAVTLCGEVYHKVNERVSEDLEGDDVEGEVFVLICALDYKMTSNPLSCSIDGKNMEILLDACGVPRENITAMYDEQCTKQAVLQAIKDIGDRCGENDYFVFYYSGHGTNLEDYSGDEADGQDEAFCFVDFQGQISYDSCMSDDVFAQAVTDCVRDDVKVIILTDCCHSGTIADFHCGDWAGRRALSIAGCLDHQTSGDIGRGGIFSHSMMMAIAELQEEGEDEYSCGKLYNKTLQKDEEAFASQQDICLQCAPGLLPNHMAWPLIPKRPYAAPYGRRCYG
uniref:Peptidase C14 caspase domain-containing protein n=1 Tax=Zooxanthella nutricula TaxID=1333877 RepID=A0A7S2QCE7_9DINO